MFTGLSAFPLTPTTDAGIDERAFTRLVSRRVAAATRAAGPGDGPVPGHPVPRRSLAARPAASTCAVPAGIGRGVSVTAARSNARRRWPRTCSGTYSGSGYRGCSLPGERCPPGTGLRGPG